MNLKDMKAALSRLKEINQALPKLADNLQYISKPGNQRAVLRTNSNEGMAISVPHEFATMLYTAERDRLVHERTSLMTALKLDEVAS